MSASVKRNTVSVTLDGVTYTVPCGACARALLGEGQNADCGGHGRCGQCRVRVVDHATALAAGAIEPPTADEQAQLSPGELARGVRLSCRLILLGDVTLTSSRPATPPSVCAAGEPPALPTSWEMSPAFARCGVAVDLGTTTLVARLYDGEGTVLATETGINPQTAWGADVISRMEAAVGGGTHALATAVRRALGSMMERLARGARVRLQDVGEVVITGNTAMLCLLTETDVSPMTHAPFACPRRFGETLTARDLGLHGLPPDTPVYLPPVVSAFLGADTVCAMRAADRHRRAGTTLLVDLGTNGEMVLAHGGRLLAASTAAGPAFEGVGVSAGEISRAGAIDRVWVETTAAGDHRLCVHTVGDKPTTGLCGSGLIDALAALLAVGDMDATGLLTHDPTPIAPGVALTQADVRLLQVAKSAIHAGILTLLDAAGLPVDASADSPITLLLAGGFGQALDPVSAGCIGLIPLMPALGARGIGNAALEGAALSLLYPAARREAAAMAAATAVVDLATSPRFANEFIRRMAFD